MNQPTGSGSETAPTDGSPDASTTGPAAVESSKAVSLTMESLVADFLPAVYRYAFRLAGSAPDAEDLVQQAFLIAQQRLEQLRDSSKARAWLFAILRSCFLKRLRKSAPQSAVDLDMDLGQVSSPWERESDVDAEGLKIALAELSDQDRTILLMFYFEDASYKQIAESLELKLGTVMSRLSRAKDRLRQRLASRAELQ